MITLQKCSSTLILRNDQFKINEVNVIFGDHINWPKEVDTSRYILCHLSSVVNANARTMGIVDILPKLTFKVTKSE